MKARTTKLVLAVKIGCAAVALLLLMSGKADGAYIALLNGSLPTTVTMFNPQTNVGAAGLTILFLVQSSGKKSVDRFETLTAAPFETVSLPLTFTSGTVRMVIWAAAPNSNNNASVQLTVAQTGGLMSSLPFTTDTVYTFDVQ